MNETNPGVQKGIGDSIKENPKWLKSRIEVMRQVCNQKFTQNAFLKTFLLQTETMLLAEDNANDGFWGIQVSPDSPRSHNTGNFKLNNLGKILMQIRENLK